MFHISALLICPVPVVRAAGHIRIINQTDRSENVSRDRGHLTETERGAGYNSSQAVGISVSSNATLEVLLPWG